MSEYQRASPAGRRGYDTKDHPLDPPAAPATSWPTSDERRRPGDGVDGLELTRLFAVLGLLGLAFVLFVALMVFLQAALF